MPTRVAPTLTPQFITSASAAEVTQLAQWGRGTVNNLAWSPDGATFAVASSLGIYLYDAETLQEIRFIDTGAWIFGVSFSPDGSTLASGDRDSKVRLWDVRGGDLLRTFEDHRILLAVAAPALSQIGELPTDTITFKSALLVKDVLDRLQGFSPSG